MAVTKEGQAEPIDLAAHLQLLGESLCTVGACLRVQVSVDFHAGVGKDMKRRFIPICLYLHVYVKCLYVYTCRHVYVYTYMFIPI